MEEHGMEVGEQFQERTKYLVGESTTQRENLEGPVERTSMRGHRPEGGMPLFDCIAARRSRRSFKEKPIPKEALRMLLWATQGITDSGYGLRASPSAGALYPIDTYVVVNRVTDVEAGLYRYEPDGCDLVLVREGLVGSDFADVALDQPFLATAAVDFIWVAVVGRSAAKYRQRAYRYIYMDAGHIGENFLLACEALGLGGVTVGAFYDDAVDALVGVDGLKETVIYMGAAGRR